MTDVYFYIDSNSNSLQLFAAISDFQKILLCEKRSTSLWMRSGFSEYETLEDYLARLLRIYNYQNELTNYIKSHIFKLTS